VRHVLAVAIAMLPAVVEVGPDAFGQTHATMRRQADAHASGIAVATRSPNPPDSKRVVEAVAAPTSPPARLTLDELVAWALVNNPTVAQARHRVDALRGKQLQVGLHPNPVVGYLGEEIGDEGRGGLQGMMVAQEIVTAGKLRLSRAVVSHEMDRAQRELETQRQRVRNDVLAAAYVALAAQRTVDLTEQLVEIGEKGKTVAEQLLRGKEVGRADALQARIEANSARLRRDSARNDYQAAWRRLWAVVGTPGMEPIRLEEALDAPLPELDWDSALARLLSSSPELRKSHAEVEEAKCALARESAGRVPNFEVAGAVLYNSDSQSTVASVGLAVPLQLFDRNQGNVHRARAELAAARQEVRRVSLSLEHRLADAFQHYADARQQAEQYEREILPDARDCLDLVRQGYRQGEFGYLELLTAQRTYFETNLAHVHALTGVWVNAARIEGMLLDGALDRPGP